LVSNRCLKAGIVVCLIVALYCFFSTVQPAVEDTVAHSEEWNLVVVNNWNELPEEYSIELKELTNGQKVDSRIYPYLRKMFAAAREEGVYPIVREGYRTAEEQQKIVG